MATYVQNRNVMKGTNQITNEVRFVSAKAIAELLSVTPRYIHLLADRGRIPVLRLSSGLSRFNIDQVMAALEKGVGR
jgi:hypothetical protein